MNTIIQDARELYQKTVSNPEYAKSHIWQDGSENHRNLLRIINTCETPEDVIEELRKTDMYAIRINDKETFDLMMKWYAENFEGYYDPELCATPNLWKMKLYCDHIRNHCPETPTIIELGGGNGQFAYVAKKYLLNRLHIDIDIPESLYMAYVCTRHRCPNALCQWLFPNDKPAHADFKFVPIGSEHLLEFDSFDLFVNTASMGELPNETIRYWMDFVQNKINVKYFYGFNRFLNTIDPQGSGFSEYRRNENEASVLFDHKWKVLSWEVEPLMARCPYEDPKIARYLEIILRRDPNAYYLTDTKLHAVKMEDWWRYSGAITIGSHRSNQLVNDMTKDGTLFKLWDAMRMAPTSEHAVMMLTYLKHIGRRELMFEEELFYKRFL